MPSADAGSLPQIPDCGGTAQAGQCCYISPPPDAGADSSISAFLSYWFVNVANETETEAGSFGEYRTDGGIDAVDTGLGLWASLTWVGWSGGDELLVTGTGMSAVGAFSGQIKTPVDFEDLSPSVFWDGGTVPLGEDFVMRWPPGGASSVTIQVLDDVTQGQILCTVADNGAFTIPSSLLESFQSGDNGGFIVTRSVESCAYSDNASISLQVQTRTLTGVQFQ